MATVVPNLSPSEILSHLRGTIVYAAPGYPEVIIFRVKDAKGDIWRFMTLYADYSPSDPELFLGKMVVDVNLDRSGELTMRFSDGSEFNVLPEPEEPDDELMTWLLITPDGLSLRFRPRGRWELGRADELFGGDPSPRP